MSTTVKFTWNSKSNSVKDKSSLFDKYDKHEKTDGANNKSSNSDRDASTTDSICTTEEIAGSSKSVQVNKRLKIQTDLNKKRLSKSKTRSSRINDSNPLSDQPDQPCSSSITISHRGDTVNVCDYKTSVKKHFALEPGETSSFPEFIVNFDADFNSLLGKDYILKDLYGEKFNSECAEALLAFETGQGIRINLKRDDGTYLRINIRKSEIVAGLKKRIRRETERELAISGNDDAKINWRYVWRTNWLSFDGEPLKYDNLLLKDLGITNNSEVKFVKKFREKRKTSLRKKRLKTTGASSRTSMTYNSL